jgi:hypothetical protein
MGSRKNANLSTNASQFYYLIPHQLLETWRQVAARKSVSTASIMREALTEATAISDTPVIAFRYAASSEPLS